MLTVLLAVQLAVLLAQLTVALSGSLVVSASTDSPHTESLVGNIALCINFALALSLLCLLMFNVFLLLLCHESL